MAHKCAQLSCWKVFQARRLPHAARRMPLVPLAARVGSAAFGIGFGIDCGLKWHLDNVASQSSVSAQEFEMDIDLWCRRDSRLSSLALRQFDVPQILWHHHINEGTTSPPLLLFPLYFFSASFIGKLISKANGRAKYEFHLKSNRIEQIKV